MGNGHYHAVGYGVLLDKKLEKFEEENIERIDDAREEKNGLRVRVSYESAKPYWAVFLYDDVEGDMPTTGVFSEVFNIEPTPAVVKRWAKFCKDIGLNLKPQLLWIADYD